MLEELAGKSVWAIALVIVSIAALFIFKKDISGLIARVKKVGGAELEAPAQQSAEAPTPSAPVVAAVADPLPDAPVDSVLAYAKDSVSKFLQGVPEQQRLAQAQVQLVAAFAALRYEQYNFGIYGSQLQLVIDLNSSTLAIAHADSLYRRAVSVEPTFYSAYSFEQWFAYLEKTIKLVKVDAGMLTLTHDGREFLKYVVNRGYPLVRIH